MITQNPHSMSTRIIRTSRISPLVRIVSVRAYIPVYQTWLVYQRLGGVQHRLWGRFEIYCVFDEETKPCNFFGGRPPCRNRQGSNPRPILPWVGFMSQFIRPRHRRWTSFCHLRKSVILDRIGVILRLTDYIQWQRSATLDITARRHCRDPWGKP